MSLRSFVPIVAVLASTALACSSSSKDADAGETSTTDGSTTTTGDSGTSTGSDASSTASDAGGTGPSFATTVYAPIIEQHCLSCHGNQTADGGPGIGIEIGKLDMSSVDAGYANLVNVAAAGSACAQAGGTRVVPGSATTSLLYGKINGFTTAPICGKAMPESGEIPDGGQALAVSAIEAWINGGALP